MRLLLPVPEDRRLARFAAMFVGQLIYGCGICLLVRANLGLDPWDVLHQGLSERLSLPIGIVSNCVGVVLLLLWWPLRQRAGVGTLCNVIVVGLAADLALDLFSAAPERLALRVPLLFGGVLLIAFATALYLGAGLGPGPRDGLMTGMHARGIGSIRLVRTMIEATVLLLGWLLGGGVGIGTVLYVATIGPLIQIFSRVIVCHPQSGTIDGSAHAVP